MTVPGLISATEVENILSGRKPYAPQLPADQMPVEAEPAVAEREFAKINSLVPPVTSTLSRLFADSFKYGVFPTVAPLYGMADRALRSAGTVTPERGQQLQQERVAEAQKDVTAAEGMADNRRQFIEETAKRAGADMAALEKRFGKEAIQSGTAPAQKRVEQEKQNVPTQEWWLNALDEFRKATGSTAISTIEAPAVVADLVQEALTGDAEKNPVREYLQAYERDVLLKTYPGDKARAKDFLTTLSAGAGSMTAFVVGGAATRALGMSAKVGSATIGGASQGTMQVRDAEDFGATTAQKWLALMGGIGVGATEALPIDRMFRRLDIATGGGVANALKRTTAASLEEFTQELVQGVGQDVVAKYLAYYDPNREMDIASYVRQGLAGAIIGGGTALIMEGASGAERAEAIRMQQEAQKQAIESQSGVSGPEVAATPEERSAAFSEAQARLNEITGEDVQVEIGPVGRDDGTGTAGDVGVQPQPAQPDVAVPAVETPVAGNAGPMGGGYELVSPKSLIVDAKRFQFKEGGDEQGVTNRLKGVEQWDPAKAGLTIVWEDAQGQRFVADGHQRVGLANRIENTPDIMALVLREADGVSAEDARVIAAATNIAQGTGSAVDAAKVLRTRPDVGVNLPPQSALVRDAKGLQALSEDAFGMVVNEVVSPAYGAIVGRLVPDQGLHSEVVRVLAESKPSNAVEAESIVRDAMDTPAVQQTMEDIFGSAETTQLLFKERAQILSTASTMIRKDKAAFNTLVREESRLAEAGNVLATDENEQRAIQDAKILNSIQTLARRTGPVSEALAREAKALADGKSRQAAARDFIGAIRGQVELVDDGSAADRSSGPVPEEVGFDFMAVGEQPTFYSAVSRTVENFQQPKAQPQQWAAMIRNAPGVKPEELEWLGLENWLAEQDGSVSKEQVLDYIRANQIDVQEVVKGPPSEEDIEALLNDEMGEGMSREDAIEFLSNEEGATKFAQYQLPGGDGYREMLLTLPQRTTPNVYEVVQQGDSLWGARNIETGTWFGGFHATRDAAQNKADEANAAIKEGGSSEIPSRDNYRSGHWDEPNVLAHVRFNERTDAEGKRVLFVEEIQSDWHQAGRKRGYRKPDPSNDELIALLDDAGYAAEWNGVNWVVSSKDGSPVPNRLIGETPGERVTAKKQFAANLAQVTQMVLGRRDLFSSNRDVPDAPFKTSWPELAFKRMLRWAVDNGYDRIAWTPGEVQAERYDLSKQINLAAASANADGTYQLIVEGKDGQEIEPYSRSGKKVTEAELEDTVGKEVASKLIEGAKQRRGREWTGGGNNPEFFEMRGLDLKVGGEGMKGFYDQILPKTVNKLVKKWGGKVGTTTLIETTNSALSPEKLREGVEQGYLNERQVWSLDITEAMEDAVLGGQPLFMATNRATGPFKAEPMRPRQGIADMGQAQDAEDIALSAMKSSLTKLLDLTVRQGRLTAGRGALGQYNQKTGVIRMKTWGDYSVLVHEAGHALNDHKGAALDQIINQHAAELRDVAIHLYPDPAVANLPRTKQMREGFAEFFRVYMTNEQAAQQLAPQFYQALERTLATNAPEMGEGLKLIRQQFNAWLSIPSTRLVQSFMVSGRKPTLMDEARAGVKEDGLIGWMKRGMSDFGYKTYLNGIDQMHALRKAVFELANIAEENLGAPFGLEASQNPHILAVLGANSQNAAMVQLKNGVRRYQSSEVVAPALRDAIVVAMGQDPASNSAKFDEQRMADFNAYLVARRARSEYQRFRNGELMKPPVAFSEGDALQAIADFEAQYGTAFMQAAQMVYDINRAMMQRAYDAGMVEDEVFDLAMQKEDYVPLMRDMSDKPNTYGESVLTTGKASIVKRFRGSDRDIIAPLDSIMNRAFALEKTIARNDVRKALARLTDVAGPGGGKYVERLSATEIKAMNVPVVETMRKVLDSPELDPVDAAEMAAIFEAAFDDTAKVQLFRAETTSEKGEPVLFFWDGGERQAIRVGDDEIAQDLYNALAVVGHENLPLLSDVLTMPAAMIRTGVTAWPDFQVVNFIRDQVSAYFLSGANFIPFVSGVRGSLNEVRNRKVAQDYNAAMGIMGGMNVASVDIARGQRDIDAMRKKGYRGEIAGDGTIAGAVKGLARFVELTETGTRLGIFEAAYNRAASEGLSEADALYEAAFLATDYMNYGSRGSRMLLATRAVPFLNASLRGLDKLVRTAFGGEAAGRRGVKFALTSYFKQINNLPISRREKMALQTGRALWLKMSALAMISAALTSAFKDDEDYQEASPYLRATGWVIPYGNGNILWIPKPFELAIISNFMERAIEMANGDDRAMERFRDGVMMTAVPPFESPTIKLAYELANNVNTFRGGPLVPDYMLRLPPELQYHARTSELAKRMGEATGVSPIKIEHTITSLFASAGRDLLPLLDRPLNPERAEKGIDETMVTRRFWRSVDRGSVSSQDFYQMMSRKNGELTQAAAGYSKAVDSGNELAANDYLSHLKPDEKAWAILNHHYAAKYKRLHPGYRANQVSSTVSSMRREIVSSRLKDTSTTGGTIPLTAKQRRLVDDVLADIQRREMRNALVVMDVPGWKGKTRMDVTRSIDMLRATNPFVAEELERRMAKAKVYNADTVAQNWPDLKQRLIADRGEAILDDLLAISQ